MLHESWYKGSIDIFKKIYTEGSQEIIHNSLTYYLGAQRFQENSIKFFENYIKTHPEDEEYIRTIIEILKSIKL